MENTTDLNLFYLNQNLREKFKNKATIFSYALSNSNGTHNFTLLKCPWLTAELGKRKYDTLIQKLKSLLKKADL
jgi:hypothetical protein